ncbi:MAG: hypothetical protein ACJ79A_06725 [Gemmatimonadaceae bacterium]
MSNAVPSLSSASPTQLVVGTGPAKLTLKGFAFNADSRARWNDADRPTTYVDVSTLTIDLSAADLANIMDARVTVVNPAPGGGTSGTVTVPIGYPIPTVTSISPSSSDAGLSLSSSGLFVEITGSNFVPQSFAYWDGYIQLPRTTVTEKSITAIIPPDYVAFGGTHKISVINPKPGGGESNRIDFLSSNPVPTIQQLFPNPAVTGAAFSLLVVGRGLTRSSVVRWNGADRPTRYDVGNLYADIPASDVTDAGRASISVYNPPPNGGTSALAELTIRQAPLSVVGTLAVENVALVQDTTRGVLYASVPSTGGARANTVVKIDPVTATVIGSVAVGSDPGLMSLADDSYLYVALRGAPKVVRIDLSTFTKDIEFDPGSSFGSATGYAEELVALPGLPKTVAVFVRSIGVVLFDDGVARINSSATQGRGVGPRIVRGPDASHVYGYNDVNTGFEFYANLLTPTGLQVETVKAGLMSGFFQHLAYDGGRVYSTNGAIVDPVALTRVGTIPLPATRSAVLPDARNGRVHYLGSAISTYSTTSFALIDEFANPALAGLNTFARWGVDGLAVGGGAKIVFLKGSLIAP